MSWSAPQAAVGVDIGCGMMAARTSLVASDLPDNLEGIRVHLGTLGTGNHFIELCLDTEQRVWIMLHSGSRGVGNAIGTFFIELAKQDMRKWFINLPDEDLAYFRQGTDHFDDYVEAVGWAQDFAALNRRTMMTNVIRALRSQTAKPFDAEMEAANWPLRK